ncbi:flagellar biosynthesis protein FlgA [Glutamicibacter arilaitensis]|uniref:Flagellar biosynthesis protein FlgA n=2 Tax=Glutamicibacter arilaitensis TaxID=256701 RepID=A0A4Y8TWS4_9MICC|nr:flagellar biosynthesis protein FlgA [Glutamicibacter arilaitensis]
MTLSKAWGLHGVMSYFSRSQATARPPVIPKPKIRPVRNRNELLRRYRKPLAIACALLALAGMLNVFSSGQLSQREVVVVISDIPAGSQITSNQLAVQTVRLDPQDDEVFESLEPVSGQRAAVALPAGTVLRSYSLVGPQLLAGSPQGTVAVPLRLSDPATVALLHPGQLVDIVLTTGDGFEKQINSETIAKAVPVLWVPDNASTSEFGMLSGTRQSGEGIVVVAAASSLSDDLAGAVSRGKVSAVLVN